MEPAAKNRLSCRPKGKKVIILETKREEGASVFCADNYKEGQGKR